MKMQAEGVRWAFRCKGVQSLGLLSRKAPHKLRQPSTIPWLVTLKTNAIFIFNRRCVVWPVFLKAYYANTLLG